MRPFTPRAPIALLPAASIATGWSEPVPGRELHPLYSSAFHSTLFRQLTKHLRWLGDKMRQFRELTRVKMRIVMQKQKGESLAL
jgi:hypothetical protein